MCKITVVLLVGVAWISSPAAATDTPPHLDTSGVNMQPAYPATALAKSERGAAIIGVNVNPAGKVDYVYPLQTSGFDDLDSAAISAVMGWKFIPATSSGKTVSGSGSVEVVFQPPDAPNGAVQPALPAPKPVRVFLPQSFQIEAKRGEFETKDGPVLCNNGTLRTTMRFLHAEGPAESKWKPAASIEVKSGKDKAVLVMMGVERYVNVQERFVMKSYIRGADGGLGYSHMTDFGKPETVTISWDPTGLVTGTVGALEQHQMKLDAAPTQFSFAMSSGVAEFTNSALVCMPGNGT